MQEQFFAVQVVFAENTVYRTGQCSTLFSTYNEAVDEGEAHISHGYWTAFQVEKVFAEEVIG